MRIHALSICVAFAFVAGCTFAAASHSVDDGGATGAAAGRFGTASDASNNPFALAGANGNPGGAGASGTNHGGAGTTPTLCLDPGPDCVRACGLTSFPVGKVPPEILIVFDRSVSMNEAATGGSCGNPTPCGSKWVEMTTAVQQVVKQTETTINWGLKFFADSGACGVSNVVTVPVAPTNATAIGAALMGSKPGGHTPTRLAMQMGTTYLKALTTPNPKFILLATDGIPNCIPGGSSQTAYDTTGAPQAVADALAMGLPTFVLGVGTPAAATGDGMVFEPTLTALSAAGGKARPGTPNYYHVSSSADVVAALTAIQSQVNSCVFNLAQVPPDPTNIAIRGGGMKLPKDPTHVEGWDYGPGMKTVQLYGSYCARVVDGSLTDVQAIFACPMDVIP